MRLAPTPQPPPPRGGWGSGAALGKDKRAARVVGSYCAECLILSRPIGVPTVSLREQGGAVGQDRPVSATHRASGLTL